MTSPLHDMRTNHTIHSENRVLKRRQWPEPVAADRDCCDPQAVFNAGMRHHHIANTAYPIAHNQTWGPYRVRRAEYNAIVRRAFADVDELLLYAHIPFCETRCYYCEYTVVGRREINAVDEYMRLLNNELDLYANLLNERVRTIKGFDIGGGTPAFVEPGHIAALIRKAQEVFQFTPNMQISMETTPRIAALNAAKMRGFYDAGVRRMSMGVQVTEPDLLRRLNRADNGLDCHKRAVENIRSAGFDNFNIDVMYGFAGQSLDSVRATIAHAIELQPEAITLYRMRYKLTRIADQARQVHLEDVHAQARLAGEMLRDAGYLAPPGKNTFARRPGDSGTSDYIQRRVQKGTAYLGTGLGAQTYSHTTIAYNDGAAGKTIEPYRRSLNADRLPLQDLYHLPQVHMMSKMIAVSFYFGAVDLIAFYEKFGITLERAFPTAVEFVLNNELMHYDDVHLRLTRRGAEQYNGVIALFYAPSIQRYLLEFDPEQEFNRQAAVAERIASRNDQSD